jgi:SAM-dependent methyltransferase
MPRFDGPKTGHIDRFSAHQHRGPAWEANAARNAGAEVGRHRRWAPARDALWDFVEPHLWDEARVAVLGAGNGDDLPLRRIAERAGAVTLIDLDATAARAARRRLPWRPRRRVEVIEHDATGGAADRVVTAAVHGIEPPARRPPETPLPGAPYDLAIGDLLYSQLLYPALFDLEIPEPRRAELLRRHAPSLTRATVARLHASAPQVVHVHDPLAWWEGHDQPADLAHILRLAEADDIDAALSTIAHGLGPTESDPRAALRSLAIAPRATALWHWPFSEGVDYLACATLAGGVSGGAARRVGAGAP